MTGAPLGWAGTLRTVEEALMAGLATLVMVDLECADLPVLAEFYHQALGWAPVPGRAAVRGRHPSYIW